MKISLLRVSVVLGAALVFNACAKTDVNSPDEGSMLTEVGPMLKSGSQRPDFEPNELIIKFKEGTSETAQNAALGKIKGTVKEKIHTNSMKRSGDNQGFVLVTVPVQALEAISKAKDLPEIEYAEPNFIYQHFDVSNDTYFLSNNLWGMYGPGTTPSNSFGTGAAEAWAAGHTGSTDIYVGIIDEGYMYTHEDLSANAGTNPGEIPNNNKDDDGNGYVDDVYGWDFAGNNNTVFDGTADDHGTHVAGTIGAVGGNGIGVAGVCWNVRFLDAKFLGTRGGTTANAIKAVDYFTDLKTRAGINIVATNNSWGGGGFSQALQDAIERANQAGILFIAAAGNDGLNTETNTSYPSGYPNDNIISVASITSTGALSSFSNYAATKVDLGAPGSSVVSSVPVKSGRSVGSGYASYSGTSMATPHVTGAVALYASTHPGASAAAIKAAILSNTTPTPSLTGKCVSGGRLNVSGF